MRIFYQKHMSHHLLAHMQRDWLDQMSHAFLIRDPRRMLASYVKSRQTVTLADLGLAQQVEIFGRMVDRLGHAPAVIDSKDILQQPEKLLRQLCAALAIPFDADMLSWSAGPHKGDGVWAPWWYQQLEQSNGFMSYQEKTVSLSAELEKIAEAAQP